MGINDDNYRNAVRFAPSPSGRMHLGNVFTALITWLDGSSRGVRRILRIEDLDPQRSRIEYARIIEDDLDWLHLNFEEGGLSDVGDTGPYSQSKRTNHYLEALKTLWRQGLIYPCKCTRADLSATQAPHASDGRLIYPGTCRPDIIPYNQFTFPQLTSQHRNLRLYIPDVEISFNDILFGEQNYNIRQEFGDMVMRRSDGAWAYQIAVVVDDALMGIDRVIRGHDLLSSSAPQIHIHNLLGYSAPEFMHLPLICNMEGKRLSKRDGDLNMESLRKKYPADAIIGYLAYLAGFLEKPEPILPMVLINLYDPCKIPRKPSLIIGNKLEN